MSWYRRFKNRKHRPYYEISGKELENIVEEYFPSDELNFTCRWVDYRFDNTILRVMRRTPYEFAIDELHTLFRTLTPLPEYYIELDYVRQELLWLRELTVNYDMIYTLDWFLNSTRPIYFFMKYYHIYMKHFLCNWENDKLISCFPCDPEFGNCYYNNKDVVKVVAGSEKRGKIWSKVGGLSKHRIFGHQFAYTKNNRLNPITHPRFRCRTKENGRYEF